MSDNDLPPLQPGAPLGGDSAAGQGNYTFVAGPSWQEQDGVLRDLWLQNKTPQEISDVLNRSIAAIMTRAARLGLPRRAAPGRKPGSRRLDSLQPASSTMRSNPRPAARANAEGEMSPQSGARICLMCLRSFPSQGRHNRICSSCKGSSEYESAVSLADIHLPT